MAVLNRGLWDSPTENIFELKEETGPCVGRVLQAEVSKYKCPEAGTWLVCLRNGGQCGWSRAGEEENSR